MEKSWQSVREDKTAQQWEAIRLFETKSQSLDARNIDQIVSVSSADELMGMIKSGHVTATDVVNAYGHRAIKAHKDTNCLTEIRFEEALKDAEHLDCYEKGANGSIGPLHGIPVTLKDQFDVAGLDTTLGYVGRAFHPAAEDGSLVKMLKSLGAIIMAKTNLPQSILWCETENPLWGLTTHPLNKSYTPGGSTGGESALLFSRGSLLGFGTDIGGSIRIPSHMMGIYGLKPSSARLPYRGAPVSQEGEEHVPSSIGPMARDLTTIHRAMSSLANARPWDFDPRCAPLPWRQDMYDDTLRTKLTIGVLYDDGVVKPHPPITRVLKAAVESLRKAGHDVFDWDDSLHAECVKIMDEFYTVDGGEDIRRDVEAGGEPFIPHVEKLVNAGEAISVYQYWQLNRRKLNVQQKYLDKWISTVSPTTGRQADVVLMPPMPHPAVPHRGCRWVGYTKVWNFLDYPALVIPGGCVTADDLTEAFDHEARNPLDEWTRGIWSDNKSDMASLSLPVGVQLIGRKLEEEKVLAAGKVLDDLIRASQ